MRWFAKVEEVEEDIVEGVAIVAVYKGDAS